MSFNCGKLEDLLARITPENRHKLCFEDDSPREHLRYTQSDLDAAVAAERERCAQIADRVATQACEMDGFDGDYEHGKEAAANFIARIIRNKDMRAIAQHFAESPKYTVEGALEAIGKRTHSDHPLRHWDRTCPACNQEKK